LKISTLRNKNVKVLSGTGNTQIFNH